MQTKHALFTLKRQYARTLGAIAAGQDKAEDLVHLAAVIRIFEPGADVSAIRAVRPYRPHRAPWLRTVIAVLREANEPLGPVEIARRAMQMRGVDPGDYRQMRSISCGIQAVLGKLVDQGLVTISGKPRKWALSRD